MKEQLLIYFWKFFLPAEKIEEKKKELLIKKIKYHVEHTSGGGIFFTFWEKIKILGFVGFLILISFSIFFLLAFVSK
ncbi:hypothetical protein M1615_03290 [Patescibacteria group bacterium]|nr:hypothetical protein [Patescibacteria group bacterium]